MSKWSTLIISKWSITGLVDMSVYNYTRFRNDIKVVSKSVLNLQLVCESDSLLFYRIWAQGQTVMSASRPWSSWTIAAGQMTQLERGTQGWSTLWFCWTPLNSHLRTHVTTSGAFTLAAPLSLNWITSLYLNWWDSKFTNVMFKNNWLYVIPNTMII